MKDILLIISIILVIPLYLYIISYFIHSGRLDAIKKIIQGGRKNGKENKK